MKEKEFKLSTPEYFMLRLYGHRRLQTSRSRERWEIARYISIRARTAMADKLPTGFFDLPWDETQETFSPEEWDEFNRMMDEKFPLEMRAKA